MTNSKQEYTLNKAKNQKKTRQHSYTMTVEKQVKRIYIIRRTPSKLAGALMTHTLTLPNYSKYNCWILISDYFWIYLICSSIPNHYQLASDVLVAASFLVAWQPVKNVKWVEALH